MSLTQPVCGFCGTANDVQSWRRGVIVCRGCYGKVREFIAQIEEAGDRKTQYLRGQMQAILKTQVEMASLSIKPMIIEQPWKQEELWNADEKLADRMTVMKAEFEKEMMGNWQTTPMEYVPVTNPGTTTYETLRRAAEAIGLTPGAFYVDPPALNKAPKVVSEPEPPARQDFTRPIEFEE